MDRQTSGQTKRHTHVGKRQERKKHRQTDGVTDQQMVCQTYMHSVRQTDRKTDRKRHAHGFTNQTEKNR